jgi:hypothetical protein
MDWIEVLYKSYLETCDNTIDESMYELFDGISYNIIKIGIEKEFEK